MVNFNYLRLMVFRNLESKKTPLTTDAIPDLAGISFNIDDTAEYD